MAISVPNAQRVVLMYHALYKTQPEPTVSAEDAPYAVSEDAFKRQLDAIVDRRDSDAATDGDILITFDDGHASNLDIALPLLCERSLTAVFFITTGFTGSREHFCDASMLSELSSAGMTLGGHGHTHAFFDDLDDAAALSELRQSHAALSALARDGSVDCMSFPGGRYHPRTLELARQAGYLRLFGSTVALAGPEGVDQVVPRVAIRRNTPLDEYRRMIGPDHAWYASVRRSQTVKHTLRRVLGNRIYHGLYKSLRAR